jgi:hypothetical protein
VHYSLARVDAHLPTAIDAARGRRDHLAHPIRGLRERTTWR